MERPHRLCEKRCESFSCCCHVTAPTHPRGAKIASHITISAKLLVGVAVLSRPTPPTIAKPPRRVVLARGYLQVGIGDPKLSILFACKMQYALTLTVVPFEFHLPPIVILGWDGH